MLNLDKVFEEVISKPKKEEKIKSIDLKDSYTLNIEGFLNKFAEINSLTDNELYELAKATYPMILESTVAKKDSQLAVTIFSNARFITALINVLNLEKLNHFQKIYCNKLVFDYLRAPGDKDAVMEQLLVNLTNTINADVMPSLLGIGLPKQLVSYIALARYSSTDEYINIKRINKYLFNTSNTTLLTEQRIVDIYQILFAESMTKLFEGIMFDVYPQTFLNSSSEESNEIYSLIGLAVLDMINTMPSDSIRFILKSYLEDYINTGSPSVRFSLKLSNDYFRINCIIDELNNQGIYLP